MLSSVVRNKLVTIVLLTSIMITTSCSNKSYISKGFLLTDLGGSNQAISSIDGSISLYPVTAYLVKDNLIFVEVEEKYSLSRTERICSYSVIIIDAIKINSLKNNSKQNFQTQSILKKNTDYINTRTCLK